MSLRMTAVGTYMRATRRSAFATEAASPTVSIVYVHGGAFVSEIQSEHWDFVTRLVVETGAAVHVPIYGLAPAHHAAEGVAMIVEVIRRCTEQGPTYVMGDSAGGGLA